MAVVVTFDGIERIIGEISVGGDNELDASEIYSEWKVWVAQSDNAKYIQAFRFDGGSPLSPTQDLGITYFLMNGWRIRPAELSHKLTIKGNIFVDGGVGSIFIPTTGAFTVHTETLVSNLVDDVTVGSLESVKTTATAGSTTTEIRTGLTQATGFFRGLRVVIKNSAGTVSRRINEYEQTNGAIHVADALPFTPAAGDPVTVVLDHDPRTFR